MEKVRPEKAQYCYWVEKLGFEAKTGVGMTRKKYQFYITAFDDDR